MASTLRSSRVKHPMSIDCPLCSTKDEERPYDRTILPISAWNVTWNVTWNRSFQEPYRSPTDALQDEFPIITCATRRPQCGTHQREWTGCTRATTPHEQGGHLSSLYVQTDIKRPGLRTGASGLVVSFGYRQAKRDLRNCASLSVVDGPAQVVPDLGVTKHLHPAFGNTFWVFGNTSIDRLCRGSSMIRLENKWMWPQHFLLYGVQGGTFRTSNEMIGFWW